MTSNHSWHKFKSGSEIRGNADLLTDSFAERIGYVFAHWLADQLSTTPDKLKIAVGRDSRDSGPRLKEALIRGVTAADSDVFDCDLCTTPVMFMTTVAPETRAHGAIMVTGSHYASGKNGFKFHKNAKTKKYTQAYQVVGHGRITGLTTQKPRW